MALDEQDLLPVLRAACGRVDRLGMSASSGGAGFVYPEYTTDFGDRPRVPMRHLLARSESFDKASLEDALRQSWDWPGARSAVDRAALAWNFCDEAGLQPKERLDLFQRALRALVARLPVLAIHWTPSQRVVDPAAYLVPDLRRPLAQAAVNVRMFRVEGGAPGWTVMDTVGMAPLLLPDLECRFFGLDPAQVAECLWHYASYLFEKGDVILDGHTIEGVGGAWTCRHGKASVGPARPVIAMIPSPPVAEDALVGVRCPACGWVPEAPSRWECECGFMWNTFETRAGCPACDKQWELTACLSCKARTAHALWYGDRHG